MRDIELRFVERTVVIEHGGTTASPYVKTQVVRVLQWRKADDLGLESYGMVWAEWVDVPLEKE